MPWLCSLDPACNSPQFYQKGALWGTSQSTRFTVNLHKERKPQPGTGEWALVKQESGLGWACSVLSTITLTRPWPGWKACSGLALEILSVFDKGLAARPGWPYSTDSPVWAVQGPPCLALLRVQLPWEPKDAEQSLTSLSNLVFKSHDFFFFFSPTWELGACETSEN